MISRSVYIHRSILINTHEDIRRIDSQRKQKYKCKRGGGQGFATRGSPFTFEGVISRFPKQRTRGGAFRKRRVYLYKKYVICQNRNDKY